MQREEEKEEDMRALLSIKSAGLYMKFKFSNKNHMMHSIFKGCKLVLVFTFFSDLFLMQELKSQIERINKIELKITNLLKSASETISISSETNFKQNASQFLEEINVYKNNIDCSRVAPVSGQGYGR